MNTKSPAPVVGSCRCGEVVFEAAGAPILSAVCCCASCQEAGQQFEQLLGASPVLDVHGGTGFILHRKDRIRFIQGGANLRDYRLKPGSPTRRVLATCCNAPVFLEFEKGHWLSLYRDRFKDGAPAPQMRVMTADRSEGVELPGDMPNYASHSGKFIWTLLGAWVAMGLRVPKVVEGLEPSR